jgi:hypothetical protein
MIFVYVYTVLGSPTMHLAYETEIEGDWDFIRNIADFVKS